MGPWYRSKHVKGVCLCAETHPCTFSLGAPWPCCSLCRLLLPRLRLGPPFSGPLWGGILPCRRARLCRPEESMSPGKLPAWTMVVAMMMLMMYTSLRWRAVETCGRHAEQVPIPALFNKFFGAVFPVRQGPLPSCAVGWTALMVSGILFSVVFQEPSSCSRIESAWRPAPGKQDLAAADRRGTPETA